MKWDISPSREMPHFFVYFSTRTVMVCLRAYGVLTLYTKSNIVKGGFELSFYGGLKMHDLGGLRINRC